MNANRNKNLQKKADGRQPVKTSNDNRGRRRYKIAAAILAVFVLHFAWQFSFIQSENQRIVVNSLNEAKLEPAPVEIQTVAEIAADKPASAVKNERIREAARNIVPAQFSPPDNQPPPATKKKAAREPTQKRLRRAEKLLTGF